MDVTKLVLPYEPTDFVAELAAHKAANPASLIEQVHLFPLGGIKAAADWAKIEPRVIPVDLKPGDVRKLKPAGIPTTVVRTLHSGGGESPMNLMYLAHINFKPANLTLAIVQDKSDGALFLTVTNGVTDRMPALNENLNVRERWDVINFIRTLKAAQ